MQRSSLFLAAIGTLLLTIAYGFGISLLFEFGGDYFEAFSWSFVMLLPYALGVLGNFLLMRKREIGLIGALLWPWVYCVALFGAVLIASVGVLFCFVISLPIFLPAASLGGFTVWLIKRHPKAATVLLVSTMFAPVLASPVEAQFETPISFTTTHTYIDIDASPETIWANIGTVPHISDRELNPSWIYEVGFARPISATLSHEGVGALRIGYFEHGLRFEERVTAWEPNERLAFTIVEASDTVLPAPLDLIDGERFDLVSGSYELESLANGQVRLHLSSTHYLETRFNQYGAWWTDRVLRNFQNDVLAVVKARAEAAE